MIYNSSICSSIIIHVFISKYDIIIIFSFGLLVSILIVLSFITIRHLKEQEDYVRNASINSLIFIVRHAFIIVHSSTHFLYFSTIILVKDYSTYSLLLCTQYAIENQLHL